MEPHNFNLPTKLVGNFKLYLFKKKKKKKIKTPRSINVPNPILTPSLFLKCNNTIPKL